MGRRIALLLHLRHRAAVEAAATTAAALASRGCEVVELVAGAAPRLSGEVAATDQVDGVDLVMAFGGDGTFLHAAHRVRDADVPLLGVNLGRLGFLAELEPDDVADAFTPIAEGAWTIEERPTLNVTATAAQGPPFRGWALNEVSVEKTARQRLLVMDLAVAGRHVTRVPADALVISTPTGSTAYAFSAGGPILSPRVTGTLVTPVAPHSVFGRTIVAAVDEEVAVDIAPDQDPAVVSCDGRDPVEVPAGGRVTALGGGRPVRIARLAEVDFYEVVRRKFGLR